MARYEKRLVDGAEVGANYFKIKERNGGTSTNRVVWRLEALSEPIEA